MVHEIIITEGVDRSGKGTALSQLEHLYTNAGYKVRTIFKTSSANEDYNQLAKTSYGPIAEAKKNFSNHVNYDLFSLGALEMVRTIVANLHLEHNNYVVLIDRFGLSNLVYGEILRKEEFEKIFPDTEILRKYIFACIKSLASIAPTKLYMALKLNHAKFEDDNANENLKVTALQLQEINKKYESFLFDLYEAEDQKEDFTFWLKHLETTNTNELFNFMRRTLGFPEQ